MACHICGCKCSSLQAVTDLAPSVQAPVVQHHSHLPADAELCSLRMRYCQPCPFFAAKPAATTVTSATSSTSSMTTATSASIVSAAAATGAATSSCTVSAATATAATAMGIYWQWSTVMSTTAFPNGQNSLVDGIAVCICLVCCCDRLCLCMQNNFFRRLTTFRQLPLMGSEPGTVFCKPNTITTRSLSFVPIPR